MDDRQLHKYLLKILATNKRADNGLPLGVTLEKNRKSPRRYCARCRVMVDGRVKNKTIGYFHTTDEAYQAYKTFKEAYVKSLAVLYASRIDSALHEALMTYVVTD